MPKGLWFDYHTKERLSVGDGGKFATREAPTDLIPLYVRGGSVVSEKKEGAMTTTER